MADLLEEILAINSDFGRDLKILAHVANRIANSPRLMSEIERDRINIELQSGRFGKLPETSHGCPTTLQG